MERRLPRVLRGAAMLAVLALGWGISLGLPADAGRGAPGVGAAFGDALAAQAIGPRHHAIQATLEVSTPTPFGSRMQTRGGTPGALLGNDPACPDERAALGAAVARAGPSRLVRWRLARSSSTAVP